MEKLNKAKISQKKEKPDGNIGKRTWKRKRTLQIGTWNVQSLSNKKAEVFAEIEKSKLDIVVLTETKVKGNGQEMIGNLVHIWSGVDKSERARAGVSIVIRGKHKRCVSFYDMVSERIGLENIWLQCFNTGNLQPR